MQTSVTVTPASKPYRHPHEQFTWIEWGWDIAALLRDIDSGVLAPKRQTLPREFIDGYATGILSLEKGHPEKSRGRLNLLMAVNVDDALALPPEALDEPLVLLHTPRKGTGILRLPGDDAPNHVLGDGNHRLARAFFDGRESLDAYALTAQQSRKYRL